MVEEENNKAASCKLFSQFLTQIGGNEKSATHEVQFKQKKEVK